MPPSVFAADEQSDHPVDTLRWIRLAEAVLHDEGVRGDTEVSILFVDETTIADLNTRFLGKDGPTDVLAFPIDEEPVEGGRSPDSGGTGPGFSPSPDEAPTLLGDVVICPTVAFRNAPEHAGTYDDELALLIVHGLLHLLGLDHEDPEEAEVMEEKERVLLGRHHRPGTAAGPGGAPGVGEPAAAGRDEAVGISAADRGPDLGPGPETTAAEGPGQAAEGGG